MANKSTLIARRDYGMKIAMPGFDVQYAGDNELLFNSSFPILQIKALVELYAAAPGSSDVSNGGEYLGTFQDGTYVYRWYHGLGYPPFFLTFNAGGIIFGQQYSVDENYIYRVDANPIKNGTKVLICPINLKKDIEYPYTAKPLAKSDGIVGDYGIKSIEYGDIEAHDFDNLGIDVRLQSQMVLAVKTFDTSTIPAGATDYTTIEINYDYPSGMTVNDCMVYGFARYKDLDLYYNTTGLNVWRPLGQYGQAPPSVFIGYYNPNSARIVSFYSMPASLVITRLPMVAAVQTGSTL